MKNIKVVLVLATALPMVVFAATPVPSTNAGFISKPASSLEWKEVPGSNGIMYANVKGDLLGGGPYEAFVKFPAGRDNPYHFHTQALPTVILQGTFYTIVNGQSDLYRAGSYYNLPAKVNHYSGCKAGADCLLFQYQSDHFDLVPVP